ncbi:MAG: ribonuclease H-like domain-containing protein [Atribacterota bacterium]
MEVPLSVEPVVVKGKEQLEIWSNGKQQFINPNSKPYFYTNEKLSIPASKIEKVKAIQLSNYKEKIFYKYYFETREALTKARIKGKTFEDNIPFILRNRLDNPDIYTKYKHKADLKFLFLDIEQFCKPEEPFPTYEDRIISIAWCTNDRKVKCAYIKKESQTDKELLELFVKQYQKINPDVLVVFNKSYDIPTILKRCIKNKIDTSHFSKNNDKPRLIGKNKITIPGVIIYDVWDSVRVDQSLTGNVESRKLKPVSDFYGFQSKNKVLPGNEISNYIGTKELVGYNKEDVYRLLHLFDIYWPGIEYNANDLKLPLNFVTDMNTTNLGIIVMGDEYQTRNIIADGKNSDRYPEIFQVKREGGNYEGALVGIDKTGLFEPVYKADYSCVDEQTEALTNHGWKKYWEINENDELYTWNVEKDIFELEKPSHMNIYDYDNELIYSESWHLSMATTPNHMMYYYKVRGLEKGKLCYNRVDELPTYIDVPITSFYKGKKHKLSDYFKLFAWIITEGSISDYPRITISQRKCVSLTDSISHIRNILINLKIPYKETKRKNRPDVEFYFSTDTSRMLLSLMENDGKHIPHFIYNTTIKEREEFIKELVYGDGTVYKDNHFVLMHFFSMFFR